MSISLSLSLLCSIHFLLFSVVGNRAEIIRRSVTWSVRGTEPTGGGQQGKVGYRFIETRGGILTIRK